MLVSPFSGLTHSATSGSQRGVPSLLAFLLYFVLLRILANYAVRLQGAADAQPHLAPAHW